MYQQARFHTQLLTIPHKQGLPTTLPHNSKGMHSNHTQCMLAHICMKTPSSTFRPPVANLSQQTAQQVEGVEVGMMNGGRRCGSMMARERVHLAINYSQSTPALTSGRAVAAGWEGSMHTAKIMSDMSITHPKPPHMACHPCSDVTMIKPTRAHIPSQSA
jgi:hypothetical protein